MSSTGSNATPRKHCGRPPVYSAAMDGQFSLRWHLRVIRRGLAIIVGLTLVGAILVIVVNQASPRLYESTARILAGPVLRVARPEINDLLAAQRVAATFADLPLTSPFLAEVKTRLGLSESLEELRRRVVSVAPPESLFIHITVTDADPVQAARIANGIADALVEAAPAGTTTGPGEEPVPRQLQIWDPAVPAEAPSSPRTLLNLLVGLVAGLFVGVGVAYARVYMLDELEDAGDIERAIGVPLLGELGIDARTSGTIDAAGLARLARLLELVARPPSRLLLAAVGDAPAGWVGEEVAANAAVRGRSTLIVRLDARAPSGTAGFDILLGDGPSNPEALAKAGPNPGLRRILAGSAIEVAAEFATQERSASAVASLSQLAEIVVVTGDSPSTSLPTMVVAREATAVVLVVDPLHARRRDLAAELSALRSIDAPVLGFVLVHGIAVADLLGSAERPEKSPSAPKREADRLRANSRGDSER